MTQSIGNHSLDEVRERASLYALSALDDVEAKAFEEHLASGCDTCREELRSFQRTAEDLALAVHLETPRSLLRTRVLERVAGEVDDNAPLILKDGVLFARSAGLPWIELPTPGVEVKLLSRDEEHSINTSLVRMSPGASYPSHRHAAAEELYLIEGEILICGVVMRAGDYCRAETGSIHTGISTRTGCLFVSKSSDLDEFITDGH